MAPAALTSQNGHAGPAVPHSQRVTPVGLYHKRRLVRMGTRCTSVEALLIGWRTVRVKGYTLDNGWVVTY